MSIVHTTIQSIITSLFRLCDPQRRRSNLTHSWFFSSSDLLKVRVDVDDAVRSLPVLSAAPVVQVFDEEEREGCIRAQRTQSEFKLL